MQDATAPSDPSAGGHVPPAPGIAASADPLDGHGAGRTAVRGAALLAGGYAASILLALISAPLLVRHLGVDYGVYITITALVTVVAGMSELGLNAMGVREWASGPPAGRRTLLADLLGARIAFTLVGIAAAFGFALAAGYGHRRMLGIGVACAGLFVMSMQSAFTVPLAARMRQGWVAAADLLRQAVQVALIVVLVIAGAGLVPMLATMIPAALASLAFTLVVSRDALVMPALHPRRWLGLLRGTLPFAAATAAAVLYLRLTIIISSLIATPHQNEEFAVAFRLIEVLISIPGLLVSALFPLMSHAARHDRERMRMALETIFRVASGIGAVVACVVATGAPLAVLALVGARPSGAVQALRILGVGMGFTFIGAASQYALLALRAHRDILVINLVALCLNGILTVVLARAHGAPGAAVALAACELVVATLSTAALRRHLHGLALPVKMVPRIALVIAVAVAADLLLVPAGAVLAACVVPALVLVVGLLSRAIDRELLRALPVVGHRL